ncbi:hypothetical protein K2Z83_13575 [Oscillochloris sp. ZM17-4]|uniref:hypothetical protein n=1 Tax=Oscillochloris sp. ZM17-4 TaxID=2866714 RepID=UPI001C72C791|nr:hypothetical protein [Oscillochloris sp. ZM17-4]MBX0328707.1 hypothetical protein [Oscillochloris sp. ZM17-4]
MSLTLGDILLHFRAQYTEVDSAFTRVERQAGDFADRIKGQLASRFTGDTSDFEAAAQRSEGMIASWSGRVKGFIRDSLTFPVGNLISNLVSNAVSTVKGSVIGMNSSLETTTLQFETLMKDSARAKQLVADLFIFAKDTPFETQPIIQASRNLQVFGGNALNTMDNLRMVGDAAAAVSEDIGRVSFWYGRMSNAIKGGTAWGEAAMVLQEMGILSADVRTKMEQMKKEGASGEEVWAVFEAQMQNFNGAMIKQAGTWAGLTSTISDTLAVTGAIAGKPLFDLAKSGLKAIADVLASQVIEDGAKATAAAMQFLIDKATQLVAPIGQVVAILKTGDFSGGLFGLAEDSPVVAGLLRVHDLIAKIGPTWQALVFGFTTGGLTGAALEVVTAIGGIEARFGPVGQAITMFDLRVRQALGQVRLAFRSLIQFIEPIVTGYGQRLLGLFTSLGAAISGMTPLIGEGAAPSAARWPARPGGTSRSGPAPRAMSRPPRMRGPGGLRRATR